MGILRNWTNRETATCRLTPVFWFADAHSVSELVSGDVGSVLAVVVTRGADYLLAPTASMMADGLTKVVDKTKFFLCRNFYMHIT